MNAFLTDIGTLLYSEFAAAVAVFARTSGAVALAPALGERSLPVRFRLVVAIAITIVVYPLAKGHIPTGPSHGLALVWLMLSELGVGLLLGIGLRLLVICLQITGTIAAQSTSLSQIFGTAAADPQPAIGHLLVLAGLAAATSLGIHVQIVKFVVQSYLVLTPGLYLQGSDVAQWGVLQVSQTFALGFSIAMPFVIAGLLYNVALGAINRAMPQLMVSFVGAPAIALLGLVLLMVLAPYMISIWTHALSGFVQDPFGAF